MEYEEALKIYRELAKKKPDNYLPYVAATAKQSRYSGSRPESPRGGAEGFRRSPEDL